MVTHGLAVQGSTARCRTTSNLDLHDTSFSNFAPLLRLRFVSSLRFRVSDFPPRPSAFRVFRVFRGGLFVPVGCGPVVPLSPLPTAPDPPVQRNGTAKTEGPNTTRYTEHATRITFHVSRFTFHPSFRAAWPSPSPLRLLLFARAKSVSGLIGQTISVHQRL